MIKILNLKVEWNYGYIYWKDSESNRVILRSQKFNKYGSTNDRVLLYLEADILLPQYQYLVRTDSSSLSRPEDTVIGAAMINDRLVVQINNKGDIFQLSKPYKNTITDEQLQNINAIRGDSYGEYITI